MQDRYLFRGKSEYGWSYGNLHVCGTTNNHHIIGCAECDEQVEINLVYNNVVEVNSYTIGQCTGLRDKNGALIFEGDILSMDNKYHPNKGYECKILIVYDKNGFCYRYPIKKDLRYTPNITTDTTFHIFTYDISKYAEIIGNIHDNPELLESEAE